MCDDIASVKPADPPDTPIDAISGLGEPFASYAAAILAADDAKSRRHAAQVAGDPAAVRAAEFDIETAVEQIYSTKHHLATALLMSLRFAIELFGEDAVIAAVGLPAGINDRVSNVEAVLARTLYRRTAA